MIHIKYLVCVILITNIVAIGILIKFEQSRTVITGDTHINTVLIFMGEVVKFFLSIVIDCFHIYQERQNLIVNNINWLDKRPLIDTDIEEEGSDLDTEMVTSSTSPKLLSQWSRAQLLHPISILKQSFTNTTENGLTFLLMALPSVLYVIQNNLVLVAMSNLPLDIFQVSYQLKIPTTAAFSMIMLNTVITPFKWFSLFILTLGVVLINMKSSSSNLTEGSFFIGIISVIIASLISGFCSIFIEKMIKKNAVTNTTVDYSLPISSPDHTQYPIFPSPAVVSVWTRNIQLACFGIIGALLVMLNKDSEVIATHGLFKGFTSVIALVLFLQSGGGLIVALVMKYADNIIKCFASAAAIVVTIVLNVVMFGHSLTLMTAVGALFVICSAWMYLSPSSASNTPPPPVSVEPTVIVNTDKSDLNILSIPSSNSSYSASTAGSGSHPTANTHSNTYSHPPSSLSSHNSNSSTYTFQSKNEPLTTSLHLADRSASAHTTLHNVHTPAHTTLHHVPVAPNKNTTSDKSSINVSASHSNSNSKLSVNSTSLPLQKTASSHSSSLSHTSVPPRSPLPPFVSPDTSLDNTSLDNALSRSNTRSNSGYNNSINKNSNNSPIEPNRSKNPSQPSHINHHPKTLNSSRSHTSLSEYKTADSNTLFLNNNGIGCHVSPHVSPHTYKTSTPSPALSTISLASSAVSLSNLSNAHSQSGYTTGYNGMNVGYALSHSNTNFMSDTNTNSSCENIIDVRTPVSHTHITL